MNRFPVYIPSYGRAENCLTADVLDAMGVPYTLLVEPGQVAEYGAAYPDSTVLPVPDNYHDEYVTYDNEENKSQGPGPARNYAWDHSIEQGYDWHWVMDDNNKGFYRFHDNRQIKVGDGSVLRYMEDFVQRYNNLVMAGPRYNMFAPRKRKQPVLTFNTRVYSCNLIRNDLKEVLDRQWAGRYNEDTDLSLRLLKKGWCTCLFNAFLQHKTPTQRMAGGNNTQFYSKEGTHPKSKMLKEQHPNVTEIIWRYQRWHHKVDYSPFKTNQLDRKPRGEWPTQQPDTYKLVETSQGGGN